MDKKIVEKPSQPCFLGIAPVEKYRLYHYLPGEKALIVGFGAALAQEQEGMDPHPDAQTMVKIAGQKKTRIILYTGDTSRYYTFIKDCMQGALLQNMRNVLLTDGGIKEKELQGLSKYLDGAIFNLQSFAKEKTDHEKSNALASLSVLKGMKTHIEITYSVMPGRNDDLGMINAMGMWLSKNIENVPLHFLRSADKENKGMDKGSYGSKPASMALLQSLAKTASSSLAYVYIESSHHTDGQFLNTHCPRCKRTVIQRGLKVENKLHNGQCSCGFKLHGVWK